jgi:hypothetical protein
MPSQPLHLPGGVDQLSNLILGIDQRVELRDLLKRLVDRHGRVDRNEPGHTIGLGEAETHCPADIAHGGLGLECSERHDLRNPVVPILLDDIRNDLRPAVICEVDVDVRHRDPGGIEEPLEDEIVFEWVETGDVQAVRDNASRGRTATRTDQDPVRFRESNEVPRNQEVTRESHRLDNAKLVIEPLSNGAVERPVPFQRSLFAEVPQVGGRAEPLRHGKLRKLIALEPKIERAHLGDPDGVGE